MTLSHTITEELTTYRHGVTDPAPRTESALRHTFEGAACIAISRHSVSICDPYGEGARQSLTYYSDNGAIADAVVDLVAALQKEVSRARETGDLGLNRSADACLELLQRICGAAGLSYPGA